MKACEIDLFLFQVVKEKAVGKEAKKNFKRTHLLVEKEHSMVVQESHKGGKGVLNEKTVKQGERVAND